MAPPHLRGRYNAVSSVTWQTSAVIGPVVAGAMLQAGRGAAFIAGLITILLVVALMARRLERHLSAEANNAKPLDPLPEEVLPIL